MKLTTTSTPAQIEARIQQARPLIEEALETDSTYVMRDVYYSLCGVTYGVAYIRSSPREKTALIRALTSLLHGKVDPISQMEATGFVHGEGVVVKGFNKM